MSGYKYAGCEKERERERRGKEGERD